MTPQGTAWRPGDRSHRRTGQPAVTTNRSEPQDEGQEERASPHPLGTAAHPRPARGAPRRPGDHEGLAQLPVSLPGGAASVHLNKPQSDRAVSLLGPQGVQFRNHSRKMARQ